MSSSTYQRTGAVLNREYIRFMIPAMLSAIGMSLSEFADSMVVSNLLDSDAFAIINLAAPIIFMVTMIYTITGQGGSLLFAECLGKKENKKADNYFTISSGLSVMTGILLVLGDLYNTLDRSMYATVLGILDKVVSIPLIGGMLYIFFGGYGLIAAFPISVALLLIIVKSWNCSGR